MDEHVRVFSTLTPEQVGALADILDSLAGTPLERTGDVSITIDDARYVISQQTGCYSAATVVRDGNQEVVGVQAPYRREVVARIASQGLSLARDVPRGRDFTLRELIGAEWETLSQVEQRNAGKGFRRLLVSKPLGELEDWTTSDNERHYRRL